MYCLLKQPDGSWLQAECTPDQEKLCIAFLENYVVRYHAVTEGLQGADMVSVILDTYTSFASPADMVCLLAEENGTEKAVGCMYKKEFYLLDGTKEHRRTTAPGPHSALIYEHETWTLVDRHTAK